jgi:hypothetical protein
VKLVAGSFGRPGVIYARVKRGTHYILGFRVLGGVIEDGCASKKVLRVI